MAKVLIIDDERGIRGALTSILEDENYEVSCAEDAVVGIEMLQKEARDIVFLDVMLPRLGGIEALEQIRNRWPEVEVVMISGHATIDTAVRAVKLGAFEFLEKPLSLDKVLTVARNAASLSQLREENQALKDAVQNTGEIVGESPEMEKVRALIKQAASSDARILITGENGSGKELVARAVHRLSKRNGGAFVEVNCAAIPDTLIESELFGHEKGAFTDAVSSRRGRFELATGGTLFLDEIGDMSAAAQAKVLRAIQEQKIERVGGEKTVDVDVRIVAATNKNLEAECEAGRFRRDLYFRLNVIPIYVPALRERESDIVMLLKHFLRESGGRDITFDEETIAYLTSFPWPGNVRELKNMAERIAILCDSDTPDIETIKNLFQQGQEGTARKNANPLSEEGTSPQQLNNSILDTDYNEAKESFERTYLLHQFEKAGGQVPKMAQAIGIYPSNLYTKLRKYNIGRIP